MQKIDLIQANGELLSSREELGDIITRMENLRTNFKDKDEQKNQYLVLAGQAGELIQKISGLEARLDRLIKKAERDFTTRGYDSSRDKLWYAAEPGFMKDLEMATVQLLGDSYRGTIDRHHIWSAVKVLAGQNLQRREMIELYDTILPRNSQYFIVTGNLRKLFGLPRRSTIKGGVLEIDWGVKDIDEIVKKAGKMGLEKAGFWFDDVKQLYNPQIPGIIVKVQSKGLPVSDIRLLKGLFKQKWLTYPFLGALPKKIQSTIANYLNNNDMRKLYSPSAASQWSLGIEAVGLTAAGITLAVTVSPWLAFLIGGGLVGGLFIRGPLLGLGGCNDYLQSRNKNDSDDWGHCSYCFRKQADKPLGSGFLKPFFWPVEKLVESNRSPNAMGNPRWAVAEIPQKAQATQYLNNYHSTLCKMAGTLFEPSLEQDLVLRPENHHNAGKAFEAALRALPDFPKTALRLSERSREYNGMAVYEEEIGTEQSKLSAFVCFANERYVVTVVKRGNTGVDSIIQSLSAGDTRGLTNAVNADYLHLTHFKEGKKVEDFVYLR